MGQLEHVEEGLQYDELEHISSEHNSSAMDNYDMLELLIISRVAHMCRLVHPICCS